MVQKRHLQVDYIQLFVLDEADEMLSRGFKEQIHDIFKFLPPNVGHVVSYETEEMFIAMIAKSAHVYYILMA